MKKLICDINLGGSTSQFLTWNKRNLDFNRFVESVSREISYRAKTKPHKQAKRAASLIGLIYDQLDADPYLLDVVITAINNLEQNSK